MSSVTMAADSTQADFIHHRVRRPVVKAAAVRSGFGRGRQQGARRERSRSRHRSSSSRGHKPKRRAKGNQAKRFHRHLNGSQSRSHDDTSDRDSDLDLSKDLLPISGYVRIKDEMVDHMFRSISNRKLRAMLPEILRPLSSDELKKHCVEQLEVMSKKRICRILGGADPDVISSSGTEEEDEDEEDSSSVGSNDAADDGPDVGNASGESEVINSTSLPAADDLLSKDGHINIRLENDDENGNDDQVVSSLKNKDRAATADDVERGSCAEDRADGVTDGRLEADGVEASTVVEKASSGLDGDEIFGITIKINDARFGVDDLDAAEAGAGCGQEESVRMNRRNIERSYRAKQLDDDEREVDSDGGGGRRRRVMEETVTSVGKPRPESKEKEASDCESIPTGLPNLDSEPEETCCPFVFLDTELSKSVEKSSSGKLPEAALAAGATESREASMDCTSTLAPGRLAHGKISLLEQSVFQDGSAIRDANKTESAAREVSEAEDDKPQRKSCPPQLRTLSFVGEPATDGEEMIIEIHEHEFSDDVGDDDGGYEKVGFERENERKEGNEDSIKGVLTEIPHRKEAESSDVRRVDEETKSNDDKRLAAPEKLEMGNDKGLPFEEADCVALGRTLVPGRSGVVECEQRGLKRRSAEITEEQLQTKVQRLAGRAATSVGSRSEERSDPNSEQKRCVVRSTNSGPADGKAVLASRAEVESENRSDSASSLDRSRRSEGSGSSRTSLTSLKRETSLAPCPAEPTNVTRSPTKLPRGEDVVVGRRVIKMENPDTARERVDRPELQISSSRPESSENNEPAERPAASKAPHRTPKTPTALSSEASGGEPETPVLSKTQLEILELEMRARAIKAMLKAQEELEKREEKVKLDEKRRVVVPSPATELPRATESGRSVVRPESKTIRREAPAGPKPTGGAESAQRVVRGDPASPRQSQDKRLVARRPAAALADGTTFTRTVQSGQATSMTRPGFKSLREVVAPSRFPTSAYRLVKKPASAARGRGGGGLGGNCTTSRIVRLSGGPRADNRSVVPVQRLAAMRQTSGGSEKSNRMAIGDREDVRRVVASSSSLLSGPRGNQALRGADGPLRYGQRDRARTPSPNRDQKRSTVGWNRRGGNYRQQVSRAGRF